MNADYQFARADRRPENGEDYNGHGSHTASTTAGNYIENTPLQAATGEKVSDGENLPFTFESTSGVAPRAHIISYQVCYAGNSGDLYSGCPESAILSAFEDAIEDGVDAINFSIGGGESFPWEDPMEMAFLSAREAGISVAAAAGNSGPYYMSADHTSPWVTTVGASTHDRVMDLGAKTINNFKALARLLLVSIQVRVSLAVSQVKLYLLKNTMTRMKMMITMLQAVMPLSQQARLRLTKL